MIHEEIAEQITDTILQSIAAQVVDGFDHSVAIDGDLRVQWDLNVRITS